MRGELTREGLRGLMRENARHAPGRRSYRVFRDIQAIKERLQINVEFVRPENFVPALAGTKGRHVFLETVGRVSFYHYDPHAQLLSKIVRGFRKDMQDADSFITSGLVDPERFHSLVHGIPEAAYAQYPALSQRAVLEAIDGFLAQIGRREKG